MDDIFCKLIRKEIPSHIIVENEHAMALLDTIPSSPGHTVVVLKKHGNNILEYTQDDLGKLMATVQKAARKIEKALNPDSITIGINHKEKKGVPHLHVHLIPRWENDGGHALQGVVTNKPKESLQNLAEKLKNA